MERTPSKQEDYESVAGWLDEQGYIQPDSAEVLDGSKKDEVYVLVWPQHQTEIEALRELETVDKVMYTGRIESPHPDVQAYPGYSHELAQEVPDDSLGLFNMEFSWAVADDVLRETEGEGARAQRNQIRRIGDTTRTLLRPGGVAAYDLIGFHRLDSDDLDLEGAEVGEIEETYADIFREELEGEVFETTEVRGRGSSPRQDRTIFIGHMPD